MHNAPSVVFPVGRFAFRRRIFIGLASSGALLLWTWQALAVVPWAAASWLLWVGLVLVAWVMQSKDQLTQGCLVWNGLYWSWRDAKGHETRVELRGVADLGGAMIVSLGVSMFAAGSSMRLTQRFAWLQEAAMPSAWHAFRCAVYARPGTERPAREAVIDSP